MEHVAAADSIAVDHRNDGLRQSPDLHLHVEHRQSGHALVVDIAATPLDVHVATRAEGLVAGTRQQHHPDVLHFAASRKGLTQLQRRLRCKGVAITWSVDGNFCNTVILFEEYLLELPNLFPLSFCHILLYFCAKIRNN